MIGPRLWPTYTHFHLPWVRGIWQNVRGEVQALPLSPEAREALNLLPLLVLEANFPLPQFPMGLAREGRAILGFLWERLFRYPELPLEERLWYAVVLPYRFASPRGLGIPAREILLAPLRRLLRNAYPPYRETMGLVDRLVLVGASRLAADEEVILHMEVLKTFHKEGKGAQIRAFIPSKEAP